MPITRSSTLRDVIQAVSSVLRRHKIDAVLTGGGCASLHSRGAYLSDDLDYILRGPVTRMRLDNAMLEAGFTRRGAQYTHARSRFFVEFPAGPLAIGDDDLVEPVTIRVGNVRVSALSATDACRDRLAAFYHWNDFQSLRVAAAIARRRKVDMEAIRQWSAREGHADDFQTFVNEISESRRT